MNLKHVQSHLDNPLDRALLAYFFDRPGDRLDRNMVMKKCGFDSPEKHPVGAYAQFASSVIRVNREIAYRGMIIVRDETAFDFFSLQSATYGASE
jgi:hypothetical protein